MKSKRSVQCVTCKGRAPREHCEDTIRGWECDSCVRKRAVKAMMAMGTVYFGDDGTLYFKTDEGRSDATANS